MTSRQASDARLFPMVGGHEGGGVVVEVGPGVDSVRPGDHVAASFFPICGRCKMCITGHTNLCDLGAATFTPGQISDGTVRYRFDGQPLNVMSKLGTFAEHGVVHEASLVKVEPDLPLSAVALVSCGVTTGWGSAVYRAEVEPGDTVVVVGVGGVGMNAVQGARMVGAKNVVAVDPVEFKQKAALDFGATHAAGSMEEALPLVTDLTRGQMADAVILVPSVMYGDLMADALTLTGKGGTCVVTGVAPQCADRVQYQSLRAGHVAEGGPGRSLRCRKPALRHPQLLALYKSGQLKLDELITRTYTARPDQPGLPGHARRGQHPWRHHLRIARQTGVRFNPNRRDGARDVATLHGGHCESHQGGRDRPTGRRCSVCTARQGSWWSVPGSVGSGPA